MVRLFAVHIKRTISITYGRLRQRLGQPRKFEAITESIKRGLPPRQLMTES
jgi:hypothetical protein